MIQLKIGELVLNNNHSFTPHATFLFTGTYTSIYHFSVMVCLHTQFAMLLYLTCLYIIFTMFSGLFTNIINHVTVHGLFIYNSYHVTWIVYTHCQEDFCNEYYILRKLNQIPILLLCNNFLCNQTDMLEDNYHGR